MLSAASGAYNPWNFQQLLVLYKPKHNEQGKIMTQQDNNLAIFIERYKALEEEIKLLQEDKKTLILDLKERHDITPKVLRKAIRVAKIRTDTRHHRA